MREIPQQPHTPESTPMDNEVSRPIVKQLLQNHNEELIKASFNPNAERAIDDNLQRVSIEVLQQYWGHGITRGNEETQLAALIDILTNNRIQGYTGKLGGNGGGYNAYTHGSFLVVLDKGTSIEKISGKVSIGVVVLNEKYYPLISDLRNMFPNRKIIKASELSEYFAEQN